MAELLGTLVFIYAVGISIAIGVNKWPAEDIALWPFTLLIKWWRRHMKDGE